MICIAALIGDIIVGQIVAGIAGVLINKTKQIPIIRIQPLPDLITCRELIGNRTTNRRVPCPEGIEFEGRQKRFWDQVRTKSRSPSPLTFDAGPFGRTVIVGFDRRGKQQAAFGIGLRTPESWGALKRIWELFKGSRKDLDTEDLKLLDPRARRDISHAVRTIGRGRNIGIRDRKLIEQIADMFATGGVALPADPPVTVDPPVADLTDQGLIEALEPKEEQVAHIQQPTTGGTDGMAIGSFLSAFGTGLASFGTGVATALAPALATTAVQLGVQALTRTGAFTPTPRRATAQPAAVGPVAVGQNATFERRALEASFVNAPGTIPVGPSPGRAAPSACGCRPSPALTSRRVGGMIAFQPVTRARQTIALGCR